jgi:dolichol-phosphate mannosyltransferase
LDISVVIPVFNEGPNVDTLARQLDVLDLPIREIIWVNDGSTDDSLQRIKAMVESEGKHKYIDLSRNFGQQIATQAGLDFANGDYVVIMDADGQDPPELIQQLYEKAQEGYDVVYAQRVKRKGDSWYKRLTASLFYRIFNASVPFKLPYDTGDFRICSHKVIEAIKQMPERNKFLRGQIAWVGFKQTALEFERSPRSQGVSNYPSKKMWRFAWDAITAFTDVPLKLVTWLGILVTIFAFLVMMYALYSRFILHDFVQGWTSLMIAVMFVGGVQMIAIGIIGSYMHRTHQNTLQRPLYFINDQNVMCD